MEALETSKTRIEDEDLLKMSLLGDVRVRV